MKLLRFQSTAGPSYGTLNDDGTVSQLLGDPFGDFDLSATVGDAGSLRLMAPVVPSKVIAVGLNYAAHAKETGMELPAFPILFFKPPTAVIGPGDAIVLPKISDHVEHECELGVVIGKVTRNVTESAALDYVFGLTCGNDISARDWQRKESQWVRAKGFDTFLPLGPHVVTDLDPSELQISTRVNGEIRQNSNTSDLIFSVPFLIADISKVMTLHPGDVIITGTPEGVSPILDGDTVEIEIEGIGKLSNLVIGEG